MTKPTNTPQEGKDDYKKIADDITYSWCRNGEDSCCPNHHNVMPHMARDIAQALEETANQKLKEGLGLAFGAVEKEPLCTTPDAMKDCCITAIREEMEKLTPKE